MIPPGHDLEMRAWNHRDVDMNLLALADAIEPAEPLFEESRIEREIEQHEVMRELEVPPLAPDLGAHQQSCAVRIGEGRGIAVALHKRQPFVKRRHGNRRAMLQSRFDGHRLAPRAADEQHLLTAKGLQERHNPVDAWIVREGRRTLVRRSVGTPRVDRPLGRECLEPRGAARLPAE